MKYIAIGPAGSEHYTAGTWMHMYMDDTRREQLIEMARGSGAHHVVFTTLFHGPVMGFVRDEN